MKCTPVAAAALITLLVALVLNIIAFALPFWSRSYDVVSGWLEDHTRATGDFATGPWGFCTDVSLGSSSDTTNHCYLFRTSSSYDFATFGNDFRANFSEHSVCEEYRTAKSGNESVELEYVSELADVAGLNATSFGKFLHSSCGGTGQSTLAFAILSILATLLGFLLLVVGMTCRKTDSRVIFLGRLMIALAVISALLTFVLWLVQSKSLNDEDRVKYGASFQLSVVGATFNLVAMGFVAAYRDDVDALDLVWMGPLYICANW